MTSFSARLFEHCDGVYVLIPDEIVSEMQLQLGDEIDVLPGGEKTILLRRPEPENNQQAGSK